MTHRGGIAADGKTGDGCGLLLAMPRAFFRDEAQRLGLSLAEQFAVGTVFLNTDDTLAEHAKATLAEEIMLARRYLAIEQIRFGHRLRLEWDLDPAAAGARLPPLVLQPLVENAVRHGVEPAAEGGTVRIRTRVKLGRAQVVIANTVPATPSRPGSGMALKNVRERLHLMHDMAAQFEARRVEGAFRVQLVVPL